MFSAFWIRSKKQKCPERPPSNFSQIPNFLLMTSCFLLSLCVQVADRVVSGTPFTLRLYCVLNSELVVVFVGKEWLLKVLTYVYSSP